MSVTLLSSVAPDHMHIYEYRLASFQKVHPRRRASSVNARSQQPHLKWPHTSPSVEKLAKAGFYYRPTANSIDNSSCFLCKKSLDGWEPDDIPAIEHAKHSSSCGWAIVHATTDQLRSNHNAVLEDPRGITMYEARKMTFGNRWPHEKKKGWLPKTAKLAEAGFHYDPKVDSDDFVQCAYCELGLDGWDPEDDPFEEHRRRQSDCKFFTRKKTHAVTAPSFPALSGQARSPSVNSCVDAPSDSGLSSAESTVSAVKGPTKASARGRKTRSASTTRRKQARSQDANSELESTLGSPPPAQPTGRAPRGKKRTSSALSVNRISLFDPNDFADDSFVKPPTTAKSLRQSKRPRASDDRNGTAHEDQQMHYESDVSNTTTTGTSKRKRGGAPTSTRSTKALSRYQIPDDEEIYRALELDLERELTEEEYATRYTKPFIKTPKRRLTRSKMVSQMQTEGPPPKLGPLPPESSIALKSGKKFTPTGMRNYFANHDLDYSLPISIPRHLAVAGENGEIDRMDEDTPLKVTNIANGRGQAASSKEIEPAPDLAPDPIEEDEIIIVSEKITKKGGGRKGKKVAGVLATENAKTKKTTPATVVAGVKDVEGATRPLAKHRNTKRRAPAPPVEENLAPVPRLRDIRQSIDGGVVLFDGGASSSEDEQEKKSESKSERIQRNIVASRVSIETSLESDALSKNRGRNFVTTNSKAKGRRGQTTLKVSDHDLKPEPEKAEQVNVNPATEYEQGVMEGALLHLPKLKTGHNSVGKEEAEGPHSTVSLTSDAAQAQIPQSPVLSPPLPNERSSQTNILGESSEGIVGINTDGVSYTQQSTPPLHTPAELTIEQCVSVASIPNSKDGSNIHRGNTKPTHSFDEALAKSFGPRLSTENQLQKETEPRIPLREEDFDPVVQQLAQETETAVESRPSAVVYKGKERVKQLKKGRTKGVVTKMLNLNEVAIIEDERATGKKIQGKRGMLGESSPESEIIRRSSTRTRGSIISQPKYVDPESTEEENVEEDKMIPEKTENSELIENGSLVSCQQGDESHSEFEPAIPPKKILSARRSKAAPVVKLKPDAVNITTVKRRSLAKQFTEGDEVIPTEEVVSQCPRVVHPSGRKVGNRANKSFAQTVTGGRGTYGDTSTDEVGQVEVAQGSDKAPVSQTSPHNEKVSQQEDEELEFKQAHEDPDEEDYKTGERESDSACSVSPSKPRTTVPVAFGEPYTTYLPLSPLKSKVSSQLPLRTSRQNKTPTSPSSMHTSLPPSSCASWTPVDLDALAPVEEEMDVEKVDRNEGEAVDTEGLLTQEERGMTVQEWVRRNAERAEEKFRERCEGVIGRLVEEGRRAVRAIEGIRGG